MLLRTLVLAFISLFSAFQLDAGYVKGYTRKDGTYVAPHYSKASNRSYSEAVSDTSGSKKSTSTSVKSSNSAKTKYTGKSYDVYQQRQEQGSRTFSKSMRQKKYEEQGGNCAHCGKHCSSVSEVEKLNTQTFRCFAHIATGQKVIKERTNMISDTGSVKEKGKQNG